MHVIGSLTINGVSYPFDEELVENTPVNFSNSGVNYYLEEIVVSGSDAVGLWITSNQIPTQSLSSQLSVGVAGLLNLANINDRASDVTFGTFADVLQDGNVISHASLQLAAPWTPSSHALTAPFPSTSYGIGVNNYTLTAGLLLGFIPIFNVAPYWHIVHQSPITMIFK